MEFSVFLEGKNHGTLNRMEDRKSNINSGQKFDWCCELLTPE